MRHSKSFDKYDPDALRELSRRAGIASGKARRKKRRKIEMAKLRDRRYQEQRAALKKQENENMKLFFESTALLLEAKRRCDQVGIPPP